MRDRLDPQLVGYGQFEPDGWFSHHDWQNPPDTEIAIGAAKIALLPPGEVNAVVVQDAVMLDINLSNAKSLFAYNSDKVADHILPADSFGFLDVGSEVRLAAVNTTPSVLVSLPPSLVKQWLDGSDTQLNFKADGLPYIVDPQMASFGRIAAHTMQAGSFGGNRADALMAEALLTGISARMIAAAQPDYLDVEAVELTWQRRKDEKRLAIAIQYAMDNLHDQNLKIADMAMQVGWSAPHFAEVFKRAKGMGPYAFILAKRLELARTKVLTTHLSLVEIAYMCGFSSQSHMTTSFGKRFGTTPSKMRK